MIQWYLMTKELREYILERNPDYKFDEDYTAYALEGKAVNDTNIKIKSFPEGFKLRFVFKMDKKYLGVFFNDNICYNEGEDRYYCKAVDEVSAKRVIYCFDFAEMVERCQILDLEERFKLKAFKDALKRGLVSFEDINIYYMIMEVYQAI